MAFLRHIFTEIMTLCLLGAFLVEFGVVRINRKHILAFVPITNDGNIYCDSKMPKLCLWGALFWGFAVFEQHFYRNNDVMPFGCLFGGICGGSN